MFLFQRFRCLFSWFHDVFGWDTTKFIVIMVSFTGDRAGGNRHSVYKRRITPLQGMLAGFLVFVGLYYRHQLPVPNHLYSVSIGLVAARTQYKFERVLALVIACCLRSGCGSTIFHGGSTIFFRLCLGQACLTIWACRNVTAGLGLMSSWQA